MFWVFVLKKSFVCVQIIIELSFYRYGDIYIYILPYPQQFNFWLTSYIVPPKLWRFHNFICHYFNILF